MDRLLRSMVLVIVLVSMTACAAPPAGRAVPDVVISMPAQARDAGDAGEAGELFLARPHGPGGELVAYRMPGGTESFRLPAGLLSADERQYYSAAVSGDQTRVTGYEATTGAVLTDRMTTGPWALSSVSATGRWLALTRMPGEKEQQERANGGRWTSDVRILDMQEAGRTVHALQFDGNFEVDALSRDGRSLFLIEYLPAAQPDHYQIRLYDLPARRLEPEPLRDKREEEVMAGEPQARVASPDGQWLLTLYMDTRHREAFIHALNLAERYTLCIDLPSPGGDLDQLKYYTLTMPPDASRIYAANAVLGLVMSFDLQDYQTRVTDFDARSSNPLVSGDAGIPPATGQSALAPDGSAVYFTSGDGVWAYETTGAGKVTGPYAAPGPITGLGVSGDGRSVYVASHDQPPQVIERAAVSGTPQVSTAPECAVTTPEHAAPPRDPNADDFGLADWYINDDRTLWAGPLPRDGSWHTGGEKTTWIRPAGTDLVITGRRLDAVAPPLHAEIPCCYNTGFQIVGLIFPTEGCWEVESRAGEHSLRFVTRVEPPEHPPAGGTAPHWPTP